MPDPVPVVALARLTDRSEQGNRLGGHLLVDALRRFVRGGQEFGARAVVVEAIDDRAAALYRHLGFHDLEAPRLLRRMNDIADVLNS
jgi:ribosomal protein S18 acetylase RimI-like enzyme